MTIPYVILESKAVTCLSGMENRGTAPFSLQETAVLLGKVSLSPFFFVFLTCIFCGLTPVKAQG